MNTSNLNRRNLPLLLLVRRSLYGVSGLLLLQLSATAQKQSSLSLAQACEMARQNYPLVKQRDLVSQTAGINIENLQKGFMPQLNISGQASYQSDVTSVSIPIPGVRFNSPSKDQYKLLADISQVVYDGGAIKNQKNIQRLNETTELQKIEVELYKLKERVTQLFLGVIYLNAQLKQADLVKTDLNTGISKTEALVNNGVAFRSSLNVLKAELLKADQRVIELESSRNSLLDVLGLFIGREITAETKFEKPEAYSPSGTEQIVRPELNLYQSLQKLLGGQYQLIKAKNAPKLGLFVQGGYGRPGLNFLENDFAFFYTAGVRFNWAFGGLYTKKKDRQLIDIGIRSVDIQKETFLLNIKTVLRQQLDEANKYASLIEKDKAIISLREKVKEAAKAQLENGVITANDYLREVNAEDQARQSFITHQVQELQSQVNYLTTTGKQ